MPGRTLLRQEAGRRRSCRRSCATSAARAIVLRFEALAAAGDARRLRPVIVIQRGSNQLNLYRRDARSCARVRRRHRASRLPDAARQFSIVVKWVNPWWYPPNSPWAKGEKPVPPGPGNPLGTRWMGLSAPGVGIHGTPDDGSIGYSVSHGCIRMHIPRRRVALRPRGRRDDGLHRRRLDGRGPRAEAPAQALSVALVAGLLGAARLEGRRTRAAAVAVRSSSTGQPVPAPGFTLPRLDADGKLSLAAVRGKAGRAQLLRRPGAYPCAKEARTLETRLDSSGSRGRRRRRRRLARLHGDAQRFVAQARRHVPASCARARRHVVDAYGADRLPGDVLRRPARAARARPRARPGRPTDDLARRASRRRSRGEARLAAAALLALALAPAGAGERAASDAGRDRVAGHVPGLQDDARPVGLGRSRSGSRRSSRSKIAAGETRSADRAATSSSTSGRRSSRRRRGAASTCSRGGCRSWASSAAGSCSAAAAWHWSRVARAGRSRCRPRRRRRGPLDPELERRLDEELAPLRRVSQPDGRPHPDRVPGRVRLVPRALRAAARAGLPLDGLGGGGGAARRARVGAAGRRSRACRSSPGSRPIFVALGAGAGALGERALGRAAARDRAASSWSSSGSTFVGLLPWPERLIAPGLLAGAQSTRLERAARRRLRRLRARRASGRCSARSSRSPAATTCCAARSCSPSTRSASPCRSCSRGWRSRRAMGAFRGIRDHYDAIQRRERRAPRRARACCSSSTASGGCARREPRAGVRRPRHVRLPNLFVVGAAKAGTTSLWGHLRRPPRHLHVGGEGAALLLAAVRRLAARRARGRTTSRCSWAPAAGRSWARRARRTCPTRRRRRRSRSAAGLADRDQPARPGGPRALVVLDGARLRRRAALVRGGRARRARGRARDRRPARRGTSRRASTRRACGGTSSCSAHVHVLFFEELAAEPEQCSAGCSRSSASTGAGRAAADIARRGPHRVVDRLVEPRRCAGRRALPDPCCARPSGSAPPAEKPPPDAETSRCLEDVPRRARRRGDPRTAARARSAAR